MRRRDVRGPGEEQRMCPRSDLCYLHSSALYMWVVGCSPGWSTGWRFLTCKRGGGQKPSWAFFVALERQWREG